MGHSNIKKQKEYIKRENKAVIRKEYDNVETTALIEGVHKRENKAQWKDCSLTTLPMYLHKFSLGEVKRNQKRKTGSIHKAWLL